ncbi:MAG: sensor histidine kinase [Eggerthellaceae bacterium]|jgi:signal transduction histidine kinase
MDRLLDKAIILGISILLLFLASAYDALVLSLLLLGVIASGLFEFFGNQKPWRICFPLAVICVSVFQPWGLITAVPFAAYDLMQEAKKPLTLLVLVPFITALSTQNFPLAFWAIGLSLCAFATLISWHNYQATRYRQLLHETRDSLQDHLFELNAANEKLSAAQDTAAEAAKLEERGRISREIHDTVGHLLTRSLLQVEALKVAHRKDETVVQELSEVSESLEEALERTRESVHNLSDEAVDLETALYRLAYESEIDHVSVRYFIESPIPVNITRCFIAIARESLTNAARHAQATEVLIQAHEYPGLWQLSLSNNGIMPDIGKKFSENSPQNLTVQLAEKGMGIRSMEERVHAIGGTMHISVTSTFTTFVSVPKMDTGKDTHTSKGLTTEGEMAQV